MPSDPDPSSGPSGSSRTTGGLRSRVERASTPVLVKLAALPALVPFVVVAALMLTGAFVGGVVGGLLLLVPITFLSWLLYLTWPHLKRPEKMMRAAVLLLVIAIAITAIVPR